MDRTDAGSLHHAGTPDRTFTRHEHQECLIGLDRLHDAARLVGNVRTRDLDSMYLATQRVFETEHLADLQMKATGYYYIPFTEKGASMGLAGIVIEPSVDLLRLQQNLIDAVAPFSERGGTAVAYITAPENAHLLKQMIEYVDNYVPEHSGKNFNPHVTVGVGREEFLKQLKAEPFDVFTFKADGVAVYQLGDFGTAAKKLWGWTPKR